MNDGDKTVLAVGAHPDDVEFMCAGTLALLKEKGYRIQIGIVASGDCGTIVESRDAISRIRYAEAKAAAEMLGAGLDVLGEQDLRIYLNDRTFMRVTELIRETRPAIVFTHPHDDYMTDHESVSRLVKGACFACSVPNFYTEAANPSPPCDHVPWLYYWAPLEGRNRYGDLVPQRILVDIGRVIDFKADMLACHKSQREWLLEQHGMDMYIETMRTTAREYGETCGVEHAEGFMQHRGNAYPRKNVLKETLGPAVVEMEWS
jgi:LmbE family N-acetylglucosaminyl deacetylase